MEPFVHGVFFPVSLKFGGEVGPASRKKGSRPSRQGDSNDG